MTAKNIVISNQDYTISILRLNLTWRYWLFRPTRILEYFLRRGGNDAEESEGVSSQQNAKLASSLQLLLEGLEVFMYNRQVSYDNILEKLEKELPQSQREALRSRFGSASSSATHTSSPKESTQNSSEAASSESEKVDGSASNSVGFLLHILPISVRIKKGAFVLGNSTTPTILVASFKSALGLVDIHGAPTKFDKYRAHYDLNMERFQVSMKTNISYDPLRYSSEAFAHRGGAKTRHALSLKRFQKLFHKFLVQRLISKKDSNINEEWRGLRRYIDDFQDERLMNLATIEEYAKYSILLDSVSTQLIYYYDVPGLNTTSSLKQKRSPKFGVDLIVSMGTFHYGPWADRQRGPLHALLFPALARDSEPSPAPESWGTQRTYDGFYFNLMVKDELIIRTPTRELSKDREQLAHQASEKANQKITRPFGWFELKLAAASKISSFNSYKAFENGWPNRVTCFFRKPEMRSSVNHDVFFLADEHTMDCNINFPLKWNGDTTWTFNNKSKNGQLFYLRDHAFLMTDLLSDFASGTPPPYEQFRPFQYNINWDIENYKLHFNVNDHNIINNALDFSNNKYICFHGKNLGIVSTIPLLGNFAKSTTIDYTLFTDRLNLSLEVPPWHTCHSFLKGDNKMGQADNFEVSGKYTFYRNIEINYSNYNVMDAIGDNITMVFFGGFIRYLFTFRENYMGDYKHFKTFEEYTQGANLGFNDDSEASLRSMASNEGSVKEKNEEEDYPYWDELKTENDLNVSFTFKARNGLIVLPSHIFDHKSHLGLNFDYLDIDIHLCHFYMDLQADFSPITGYQFTEMTPKNYRGIIFNLEEYRGIGETIGGDVFIDNFQVHTHRMLGLAPSLLTYHCKWDFSCASFLFDTHPSCLAVLKLFFVNFITGFKDLENTFIYEIPLVFDMANVTFRCEELIIRLDTGIPNVTFKLAFDDMLVAFCDIANERYSSKICVSIPSITVDVADELFDKKYLFCLRTSLMFTDICRKAWPNDFRRNQQAWARRNDAPTHRIPFLMNEDSKDVTYENAFGCLPTSITLPHASIPLTDEYFLVRETKGYDDDLPSVESLDFSLCDFDTNERFDPTTDYHASDVTPDTKQEPGHKTDAFILEFDAIDGFLTPLAVSAFLGLAEGFNVIDIETLLDFLQAKTVKDTKMFITPLSVCDNIRFVAPEISFRISEEPILAPSDVICSSPKVPVMTINVQEPSIAFTKLTTRIKETHDIKLNEPLALATHIKSISAFLHDPQFFSPSATCLIEELEIWLAKDDEEGLVTSILLRDMKLSLFQGDVLWLFSFIKNLITGFADAHVDKATNDLLNSMKKLIFLIANAAKTSGLDHDPTVLTKPSSVLRSCDDHVRFYDGWKLGTKFRSIVQRLSKLDYERMNEQVKDTSWIVPLTAKDEVSTAFSSWRTWERQEVQREIYLAKVFDLTTREVQGPTRVHLEVMTMRFELIDPQGQKDCLSLRGIKVICHKFPNINQVPKTLLYVNFEEIDAGFSMITVKALRTIRDSIEGLPKREIPGHDHSSESGETSTNDVLTVASKASTASRDDSLFFAFGSIKLAHVRFQLPHSFVELSLFDNFNGFHKIRSCSSLASNTKEYNLSLGRETMNHVELTLSQVNLMLANAVGTKGKAHQVDIGFEDCEFKLSDYHGQLLKSLCFIIEEDLPVLKSLLQSNQKIERKEFTKSKPFQISELPDFQMNFLLGHISCDIQILCPLFFQFSLLKSQTSIRHKYEKLTYASKFRKVLFDIKINEFPLLRIEDTHFLVSLRVIQIGDVFAVDGDLNLGFLKLTNLNVTNSLHELLKRLDKISQRVSELKLLVPPRSTVLKEPVTQKEQANALDKIVVKINLKQENLSFSTFRDRTRYSLELDGMSLSATNIFRDALGFVQVCSLFGEYSIPVMRITLIDQSIPVGLSTLLDLNVTAKVSNDVSEDGSVPAIQTKSLQIESEHLRICLSPCMLFKLVDFVDLITKVYASYEVSIPKRNANHDSQKGFKTPQSKSKEEKSFTSKFSSVHVLFYNFCIGWLFGSSHKDYPGIILGAERIFAVTKHDLGKLSLMEGYLSAANGNTSTSFYSMLSELNSLNRAFMPKMQFNYCITKNDELWVDLKGDELDVRFMSNSLVIVERTVKSGSEVQDFFQGRSRVTQRRKSYKHQMPQKVKPKPSTPFKPPFSSVHTSISFAGSRVLFYRLQEENLLDVPPSLSLQSPSVNLAVQYKHLKDGQKKHNIKFEVLMKLSDNTVYSSCVPVIMDFVDAMKLMLRNSKRDQVEINTSIKEVEPSSDAGSNIGKILKDVDFHLGVIIESQKLSLSCEPTAKVAAIVEFDGASVLATNNLLDSSTIDIVTRLDRIGASLQHIYSDEKSGFIGLHSIVVSNSITFEKTVNIVSSGCISDVKAYVKMKQYQDVDLFRDIWYPKSYQISRRHLSSKLPLKKAHSRKKEVTSSYAIPFSLTYILSNCAIEVDFGVALGVVVLEVNKSWLVSRKTSDWFYDMDFGLQELLVNSQGRLGGYVKLDKANVHSTIEWRLKELPLLDVPLVKFSGGFNSLTLKLSFDQHTFAVGNMEGWRIEVYNRKNGINILKDHLYMMIQYKSTEVFLTSLAASDFHDIFSTMSRMLDEKRTYYREILDDSSKDAMKRHEEIPMNKLLEVVKKLETNIEVRTGTTAIQVYPQSFDDTRVLYIQLDKSNASFFQNEYTLGVSNEIELRFNNLKASLSTAAGISSEAIDALSVPEFVQYARNAKGGTIFLSPKFMISMRTFQRYNTNVIEYLFQSSFGGTVDVRWNLGSVNCVREMYAAHRRALASRTEYSGGKLGKLRNTEDIENAVFGKGLPADSENDKDLTYDAENAKKDIDKDIRDTFEKVATESKFTYVPLAPPIIEAPQLKELGNATPPLEWFGLHRDKFPDATHQLAIVTLQKLIHEIDEHYSKALGPS